MLNLFVVDLGESLSSFADVVPGCLCWVVVMTTAGSKVLFKAMVALLLIGLLIGTMKVANKSLFELI